MFKFPLDVQDDPSYFCVALVAADTDGACPPAPQAAVPGPPPDTYPVATFKLPPDDQPEPLYSCVLFTQLRGLLE